VTFNEVLSQTIAMLQHHGRVSYRALKRQFAIDDAFLEDLTYELTEVHHCAIDHDGTMLVWTGDARAAAAPMPAPATVAAMPPPATGQVRELLAYTPPHLAEQILTSRSALEGERKQVTVVFADTAGFTALARQLDPEVVHEVMDHCFRLITAEVHRFEGTINQYTGDGVMALFGAPLAHEDSPRRAVHAALSMQRALQDFGHVLQAQRGFSLPMRIGMNTGLVVVGKIGDDLRMDYTAVGDTTNLAARLQQLAQPGTVVISEATHKLVAGYFETRDLGERAVKGHPEPAGSLKCCGHGGGAPGWRSQPNTVSPRTSGVPGSWPCWSISSSRVKRAMGR
jgi:class 3 adenylate cyclase